MSGLNGEHYTVELGSISAAAERNLVSHPAVSKAIQTIERDFNKKLLNHQKKSFHLTQQGLAFAAQAKSLLQQFEQIMNHSDEEIEQLKGIVSLGLSRTLGKVYLPQIIHQVRQKYPQLKVNVSFGTTYELSQRLLNGGLDISLTLGKPEGVSVSMKRLREGKFVLIQSTHSQYSLKESLQNLILTQPRVETQQLLKSIYRRFKIRPPVNCQISSWDMICDLVAKDMGVGLVPDLMIQDRSDIKVFPQSFFQYNYELYLSLLPSNQPHSVKALSLLLEKIISPKAGV